MLVLAAAYTLDFVGLCLLALSQARHWRQVGAGVAPHRRLRAVGTLLLAFGMVLVVMRDGASIAVLIQFMLLAAAALSVTLVLAFKPRLLKILARAFIS